MKKIKVIIAALEDVGLAGVEASEGVESFGAEADLSVGLDGFLFTALSSTFLCARSLCSVSFELTDFFSDSVM